MKYGKITGYTIYFLLIFATVFTWCWTREAKAATIASQTFVLPSSPDVTYDTNTYIMLFDMATGDLIDGDDGTTGAAWSAAGAAIETAAHGTYTEAWVATIPALSTDYEYGMVVWSGTNYSNADTFQSGPFIYDPVTNKTFSDTNPIKDDSVRTKIYP